MSEHHAVCPLCIRIVTKDTESEAAEVVKNHNDKRHNGDHIARVVGPYKEDLNEFMSVVMKDYGSEVYGDIAAHIVKVDPWGVRA